jgi:hypothetical protein
MTRCSIGLGMRRSEVINPRLEDFATASAVYFVAMTAAQRRGWHERIKKSGIM